MKNDRSEPKKHTQNIKLIKLKKSFCFSTNFITDFEKRLCLRMIKLLLRY